MQTAVTSTRTSTKRHSALRMGETFKPLGPESASPIYASSANLNRGLPAAVRDNQQRSQEIAARLQLLQETLCPQRRLVHAGDRIYRAGERFASLYVMNSGFTKIVNISVDGREQLVSLQFRGDWLGFDGIAKGQYVGNAIAMDTGEIWVVHYDALLKACGETPALLTILHEAISREISRQHDFLTAVCTLPADARVAEFLLFWIESVTDRGLLADQITLRMTRAEIGNYLGMTLETASRALSRLAREKIIVFADKGRRELHIPDVRALASLVSSALTPALSIH